MAAVSQILSTVIILTILMFVVNRSQLFGEGKKNAKNSEADIFMKQTIGLELMILVIFLSALYFSS